TGASQTVSASDPNYHFGTNTILRVQKDINAVDPLHPTAAGDANDPNNPRQLVVGTNVVWTYLLTNPGLVPLTINSVKNDATTFTGPLERPQQPPDAPTRRTTRFPSRTASRVPGPRRARPPPPRPSPQLPAPARRSPPPTRTTTSAPPGSSRSRRRSTRSIRC